MGKKSRLKKERRENAATGVEVSLDGNNQEPFLAKIIHYAAYLIMFAPLIVSSKFYFPFVGPKSLYIIGLCLIVFFLWIFLIIGYRQYRPKLNVVLIALSLFLVALTLSSIFGVDFSRSFWSKYERMTGLLMWLSLFGFFLAVSSTFKKVSDWKKVFTVSVFVSSFIAFSALLEQLGVKLFAISGRGGFTLGNTSFLGTYLLFNVFLALWLFFQGKKLWIKIPLLISVAMGISAMYLQSARAATISTLAGFGLIFLLWLGFGQKFPKLRIVGKISLAIFIILILASITLLFLPNNPVRREFGKLASQARFDNWKMAEKGFLEKPLLGWGPENYTLVFPKFFNPCLFTKRCGGEIWFDRSHNIVFDTLVTTGIFGFLMYLGVFISLLSTLWKKYLKGKSIDFWTFAVFTALPAAYFVQNLTVFDMAVSLLMFVLSLGFISFLAAAGKGKRKADKKAVVPNYGLFATFLIPIFLLAFFEFFIRPLKTDALVIKSIQAKSQKERVNVYKKTLAASPMGRYQIREFFAEHSQSIIKKNLKKMPKESIKKELDFIIQELKKTRKQSPLDYRAILRLAQTYNLYVIVDKMKIPSAEKYGKEAFKLSPKNQQSYWTLLQTKLYQGDFKSALDLAKKAISLEPALLQSYRIAVQVAQITNKPEEAKTIVKKAIEANPKWKGSFNYSPKNK